MFQIKPIYAAELYVSVSHKTLSLCAPAALPPAISTTIF